MADSYRAMEYFGGKYWAVRGGVFDELADAIACAKSCGYKAKVQHWTGSKWVNVKLDTMS